VKRRSPPRRHRDELKALDAAFEEIRSGSQVNEIKEHTVEAVKGEAMRVTVCLPVDQEAAPPGTTGELTTTYDGPVKVKCEVLRK